MRVALLADIHGNAPALQAALAAAGAAGAREVLVAGDLVGYYHHPDRVLALLEGWSWRAVRGNHEGMLAAWRRGEGRERLRARYGSGLEVACRTLTGAQLDHLQELPHPLSLTLGGRRVLLCHGTPWDPDEYVYPDAPAGVRRRLAGGGEHELVVCGHTHHPLLWEEGGTRVVNPGSVGQPRDRHPGASWMLWDTASGEVHHHRTPYDPRPLQEECARRDPHLPYLAEVLARRPRPAPAAERPGR